ncbi:MAG: histidine ammonia-lyase [Clostridia bacterium]|nr:histidine ammonia-lyase [Clostridia bacterium]
MSTAKKQEAGTDIVTIGDDETHLTIQDVAAVARQGKEVALSAKGIAKIEASRVFVEDLTHRGKVVYGVTTGFGKFSNVNIGLDQLEQLQENLIVSHAVGVGNPLGEDVVRGIMLLRANALARGYSGVRPQVVETLVEMLNKGVHPIIPEKGSLGASGDLCPLAHMTLVMIGRGEAYYRGVSRPGKVAMNKAKIPVISLQAKEGLALINGTQAMTAIGALALHDAETIVRTADITAAMTFEALEGTISAYDHKISKVRPHGGQGKVAANLRRILKGSRILADSKQDQVQDAYALRCVPQVHGASRDALDYIRNIIETEMNSVTDNPLIFPEEGEVISGGNFHGQPIALAMDFLGICMSEIANIGERRIERLVNPALNAGLPAFLTRKGGLNSGLMIAQYTAASLVSENKLLATPASVDSIPSSANQEDHVSMGTIAARKAAAIVENTSYVLAVELLCASQALDLRGGKPAPGTGAARKVLRKEVRPLGQDREMKGDMDKARDLIKQGIILDAVEGVVNPLH